MEKIEVSVGELVDKLSILEIKLENISDSLKKKEVEKEYSILKEYCNKYITKETYLYYLLKFINYKIWNLTDIVKKNNILEQANKINQDSIHFVKYTNKLLLEYGNTYKEIFDYNQKRFRIKNFLNIKFNSGIKEQKSYNNTCCKINVNSEEILLDKIPEINSLLIEYDYVTFETGSDYINEKINKIFHNVFPNILPLNELNGLNITTEISIENYSLSNDYKLVYDFIPIIYDTSGYLGDVIHVLSIINEKFYETGKKGILVINEVHESFRFGLEKTHEDTYDVFINERYIFQYYTLYSFPPLLSDINYEPDIKHIIAAKLYCKEAIKNDDIREIYNNAPYRINLSLWRNDDWYLNPMNVSFEKTYNIKRWGHHKWLNIQKDNKYENYVIINVNPRRTISNINFKEVFNNFAAKYKLLFICNNEDDYYHFVSEYLNNISIIPCHICKSFSEVCTIISSCKLFIGGLSMFLTIAHATQVQHFVGIKNDCVEQKLYCNIKEVFPTSNMYIEDISRIYKNPDF